MLIQNQTIFNKNFDTGGLPLGNYTIGLELIYLNGTAPSSAHFEIVARKQQHDPDEVDKRRTEKHGGHGTIRPGSMHPGARPPEKIAFAKVSAAMPARREKPP